MPPRCGRNSSETGSLAVAAELRRVELGCAVRQSNPPLPFSSLPLRCTAPQRKPPHSRRELFTSNPAAEIWPNARIALPPIDSDQPRPPSGQADSFE
jgi:hypothetical protein